MHKNKKTRIKFFENRRKVLLHLQGAGYQVSRGKLYGDFEKGLIRKEDDGSVLEAEVRHYALNNLSKDGAQSSDPKDLHSLKNRREVEKLEEQIAKLRFDREKDMGKYILRKDFEAELAARAAVFDSGFRHLYTSKVREWIALVGGRPEKSADFLQTLNRDLDKLLSKYATVKVFQVMFTEDGV